MSLLAAAVIVPSTVYAATEECTTTTGSYGNTSTTCKVLGTSTTVHATVDAGIGDVNFVSIALGLIIASGLVFGLSKVTQRMYWFD